MGVILQYVKSKESIGCLPFVDINPVSYDFFSKAQIRISTYELKHNAICLKGENLLQSIPDVNSKNYDYKIQNIEIVKGLKILLLESYNYFVNGDITSVLDFERYNYFLSSSYLNVLRTLLPLYNCFELTIEDRVNALSDLKYDKRNMLFFGEDWKVEMLADLTIFFLNSLRALKELVLFHRLSDEKIELVKKSYNKLLYEKNAFELKQIVEDYMIMEKNRWKIIGSKD